MKCTIEYSLFQNFGKLYYHKTTGLNLFVFDKNLYMQNISEKNQNLQVAHEQRKFEIIHKAAAYTI